VAVIATLIVGGRVYFGGAPDPIDSIAVLPFANANGDPNMEYLSDGITVSLINNLSQVLQSYRDVARIGLSLQGT
jgi:TolB-like protein